LKQAIVLLEQWYFRAYDSVHLPTMNMRSATKGN
jgi:hypothetical protein